MQCTVVIQTTSKFETHTCTCTCTCSRYTLWYVHTRSESTVYTVEPPSPQSIPDTLGTAPYVLIKGGVLISGVFFSISLGIVGMPHAYGVQINYKRDVLISVAFLYRSRGVPLYTVHYKLNTVVGVKV